MAILITGGARSGKSGFAEQYAQRSGTSGLYIATCQCYDVEMEERIGKHRQDRLDSGFMWETVEEPFDAAELLTRLAVEYKRQEKQPPVILLDCLTLWLTNWLLRLEQEDALGAVRLEKEINKLLTSIRNYPYPLLLVTNEVGDGIVPEYPLGRLFRDEAGRLHQRVAAICERVFLVTAGIPIELKSRAFRWDEL